MPPAGHLHSMAQHRRVSSVQGLPKGLQPSTSTSVLVEDRQPVMIHVADACCVRTTYTGVLVSLHAACRCDSRIGPNQCGGQRHNHLGANNSCNDVHTFNIVLLGHALPNLPHQQCACYPYTLAHTPVPGALLSHVAGGAPGLTAAARRQQRMAL